MTPPPSSPFTWCLRKPRYQKGQALSDQASAEPDSKLCHLDSSVHPFTMTVPCFVSLPVTKFL